MRTQKNEIAKSIHTFDQFKELILAPNQLTTIKGGIDIDGDGVDDDVNGVIGTIDVVVF